MILKLYKSSHQKNYIKHVKIVMRYLLINDIKKEEVHLKIKKSHKPQILTGQDNR